MHETSKTSKKSNLMRKLALSFCAMSVISIGFPSGAFAAPSSAVVKTQIEQQISKIQSMITSRQLDALPAQLKLASASYKEFTSLGDVQSLDQNKWQVAQALRQDLVFTHLGAAQALYDAGKYQTALTVLEDARVMEPKLPVTLYFEALNLLKSNKEWDATEKLYQAMRLNKYPAQRKIENPLQPWEVLTANPVQLESRIDEVLKSLGKDTEYPISLNFKTGKHDYMKLVPGVGANIQGRNGQYFNVYLKDDMINDVLDNMGKPAEIVEKYMRDQMLTFNVYDEYFIVGMNPENMIERIQVDKAGYSVEVDNQIYRIGDSIDAVQKNLGDKFGFEKLSSDDPKIKETWVYNEFGLSVGVTPDNKIGLISIWTLE